MSKFQTDALRPSSLPSASLGRPKHLSQARGDVPGGDKSSLEADLQKTYEEWNKRIDEEVRGLSSGLKGLVDLANIGESPSPHAFTTTSLDLQLRTSNLIRAVQNLRDIAHDLKLTLLLSDQISLAARRDAELRAVRREIAASRLKVGAELVGLVNASPVDGDDADDDGDGVALDTVPVGDEEMGDGQRDAPDASDDDQVRDDRAEPDDAQPPASDHSPRPSTNQPQPESAQPESTQPESTQPGSTTPPASSPVSVAPSAEPPQPLVEADSDEDEDMEEVS